MSKLQQTVERLKAQARNVREKAEKTMSTVVYSGETTLTGFGFSYARGRFGDANGRLQVQGVDLDLLSGLLGLGTALVVSDRWSQHAASIATGALTCYGVHKGFELGATAKSKKTSAAGRAPAELGAARPRVNEGALNETWAAAAVAR